MTTNGQTEAHKLLEEIMTALVNDLLPIKDTEELRRETLILRASLFISNAWEDIDPPMLQFPAHFQIKILFPHQGGYCHFLVSIDNFMHTELSVFLDILNIYKPPKTDPNWEVYPVDEKDGDFATKLFPMNETEKLMSFIGETLEKQLGKL
jgi:hypothetical protein